MQDDVETRAVAERVDLTEELVTEACAVAESVDLTELVTEALVEELMTRYGEGSEEGEQVSAEDDPTGAHSVPVAAQTSTANTTIGAAAFVNALSEGSRIQVAYAGEWVGGLVGPQSSETSVKFPGIYVGFDDGDVKEFALEEVGSLYSSSFVRMDHEEFVPGKMMRAVRFRLSDHGMLPVGLFLVATQHIPQLIHDVDIYHEFHVCHVDVCGSKRTTRSQTSNTAASLCLNRRGIHTFRAGDIVHRMTDTLPDSEP